MNTARPSLLEVGKPKLLTLGAMLVISAYGVLLCVPILAAILYVSLHKLGVLTVLVPLLVVGATLLLLPFGFGNPYLARLVRRLDAGAGKDPDSFIVQLVAVPSIGSDFRWLLEDSDDIGCLRVSEGELVFQGDSVRIRVPWAQVREVRQRKIGWRGLIMARTVVTVSGLGELRALEFAERCTWSLPASAKMAKTLFERVSRKFAGQSGPKGK